jgi:hypothetical protein
MEIEMNVSMIVGLSVVAFVLCCLCGSLVFLGARQAAARQAAARQAEYGDGRVSRRR